MPLLRACFQVVIKTNYIDQPHIDRWISLFYVGVDIGTSSIKFIVLNEKLDITETIQREVDLSINKDNIVQYNPAQIYELVRKELERLSSKYGHIRVGLICHSLSLVIMDRDGKTLETTIWLDKRAEIEVNDLLAIINERALLQDWF
jgi:xylulokinase